MTLRADDLLGRDYFYRRDGDRLTSVTVIEHDPKRGWKLACRGMQAAWVSDEMLRDLFEEGVLHP